MKLLAASFWIAMASSGIAIAAPAEVETPQAQAALVSAPSAERIELARRFIALTEPAGNMMEVMRASAWQTLSQNIEGEGDRLVAKDGLNLLFARLEPRIREAMPDLLEKYALVYAREFSADDLRVMVAFAESPTGSRYLRRYVSLESDPLVMEAQAEFWENITPAMEDFRKEMCGKRAAQRIAAGDTKAKCALSAEPETQPS